MPPWLQVVIGLVALASAAEVLVRGAATIAKIFGVSPLLVGLTIVAYGTSAPELAVSLFATARGAPEMAVGNVVGSNVANLGLVLGLSALILPLAASAVLLRREIPFLLISALLIPILGGDGTFSHFDGLILVGGAIFFSLACLRQAVREERDSREARRAESGHTNWKAVGFNAVLILVGAGGLIIGGDLLVDGATAMAKNLGISDRVVGLTVVAIGTSLPELATSIASAIKKEMDMAVGNVVGSNIFNVFFILGATATITPIDSPPPMMRADVVIMVLISAALIPIILTQNRVSRVEGGLLLATYGLFMFLTLT